MADWSRIVNTTIHKYLRGAEQSVIRNRKLLALMQQKGKIVMNQSGDLLDWKVRYKRAPVQGYADSGTLTFARRDRWKTAQIAWRGYATTDSMTKLEKLKNKGTEAIVNVYKELVPNLMEDVEDFFGDELYIDGNAAGNSNRIHGIESFMGQTGTAQVGSQPVGVSNSTYGGLSTVLGNYGGSWSVDGNGNNLWPTGTGDAHYDFWTPLIVDYHNANLPGAPESWQNNCQAALRYGIVKSKKNKSAKGDIDVIMLNDELYRLFLEALASKERLNYQRSEQTGLWSLGFRDVVSYEGADVTYEYGVPTGVGYGWNLDYVELLSLQSQLFVPEGPDWDIATQSYRFSIDFFGNLRFKALRNFVKWQPISGSTTIP